jgi:uncharacterized protein YuzB (UPF0349 family)
MKIRLCEHNKGAGKLFKLLKREYPDVNIKLKDCIKKCGLCHKNLFVTVEGKPVSAVDAEELMSRIRRLV